MKLLLCALALGALLVGGWTEVCSAEGQSDGDQRNPAFEKEIVDRLAGESPEAARLFMEATGAYDGGDFEGARAGFERVLALAPDFPDAHRRLSYVQIELDDLAGARTHANRAYRLAPTALNKICYAYALLLEDYEPMKIKALNLARDGALDLPDDPWAQKVLMYAAVVNDNRDVLFLATTTLMRIDPEYPIAYFYAARVAANDGAIERAGALLEESRRLGMPAKDVEMALQRLDSTPLLIGWARAGALGVGAWVAVLLVLFLLGLILSRLTLMAVRRTRTSGRFEIGSGERWMRRIYGAVIAVTSIGFYVSIPLLVVTVIALTLAVAYLFLVVGYIPVKLAIVIGIASIVTLYAVIRSIFARVADEDPGRPLTRDEAPGLWALTEEVAQRLGTRPVEEIHVTPGPGIAVVERGGIRRKLQGKGRRCLILGLGALEDFRENQFRSILAHEYGHFFNRDTAGGNLAHQVRLSIHHMGSGLAYNGLANWYNPAWLFVNGYYRVFQVVTLGASRLQEVLADRYAAMAYGVRDFADGLKQVVRRAIIFDAQMGSELRRVGSGDHKLENVYVLPPIEPGDELVNVDEKCDVVMNRPASKYDSHPPPNERIGLLSNLDAPASSDSSAGLVWDLFRDPEALQLEMTAYIQENVDQRILVARQMQAAMKAERG